MSLTCKQACPASLVWIRDLEKTSGAWAGKSACGIAFKIAQMRALRRFPPGRSFAVMRQTMLSGLFGQLGMASA
jgi:hypothetical protein